MYGEVRRIERDPCRGIPAQGETANLEGTLSRGLAPPDEPVSESATAPKGGEFVELEYRQTFFEETALFVSGESRRDC